ncbi:hypothetical protein K474DRAFT_1665964 [Panus rudis PR-1116 ss-1]|nr:hypothetical protein K474DRAFT_1665964 [Panus rudis PR-1116 ss-1]
MTARVPSPPHKRIKLESPPSSSLSLPNEVEEEDVEDESDVEQCSICLQPIADRTVIPTCSHEFCFECLLIWTDQSRRCPLCSQDIGDYLIHHIRSKYDFQKHYLTPLRTSPKPQSVQAADPTRSRRQAIRREVEWGRRVRREREIVDQLDRAIEKRRWVYRNRLYAKHVASNPYTRYRPFPTPAQFAANPDLITRATIFIRRELQVWGCLDVEFLTTFTISLMKSIDIRSEPAIKLLAEFLDMDTEHELRVSGSNDGPRANAEHFAHELYCYLRSPYRDLSVYDSVVQYDVPEDAPSPEYHTSSRRWYSESRSPSPHRSRSRSCSRSRSPPRREREHHYEKSSSRHRSRYPIHERRHSDRHRGRARSSSSSSGRSASVRREVDEQEFQQQQNRLGHKSREEKGKGRATDVGNHQDVSRMSTRSHRQDANAESGPPNAAHERSIRDVPSPRVVNAEEGSAFIEERNPASPSLPRPEASSAARPSNEPKSRKVRSPWETLHTHLSRAATSSGTRGQPAEQSTSSLHASVAPQTHATKQQSETLKPSLLDRLSDALPSTASDMKEEVDREPSGASHDPGLVDRPAASVGHTGSQGKAPIKLSAPEIMARTRARLARLTRETSQSSVDQERRGAQSGTDSRSIAIEDVSTTSSTVLPAPREDVRDLRETTATLREKLLSKLEAEKVLQIRGSLSNNEEVYCQPTDKPSVISVSNPTTFSEGGRGSSVMGDRIESETKEARLRSQAQLRARLAVEKRMAMDQSIDMGSSHIRGRNDGSEKEELLRVRLREKRG